jgi:hypothetical protein
MNRTTNYICVLCVFTILYFWSSKIYQIPNTQSSQSTTKYNNDKLLTHTESKGNYYHWIMDSNVCTLGKITFFLWIIVLLFNIYYPVNKVILNILAILTIIVTAILNFPLFVRSIPAFIVLLVIINKIGC